MLDDEKISLDNVGKDNLLAGESDGPINTGVSNSAWPATYQHLEARLVALRSWRLPWWHHWSKVSQYFNPKRFEWLITANKATKGSPINESIIDSTGLLAVRTCASGMWSGLTSPSRPWVSVRIAAPWIKPSEEMQEWLEDTRERLYSVLAASNFYTVLAQAFEDVTVIGTAPIILFEDEETVFQLYLPVAGEYYLSNGAKNIPDSLYTEISQTVLQIVEKFGVENCPTEIRAAWMGGKAELERQFVICMAIEPNFSVFKTGGDKSSSLVSGKFPYRQVWWAKGSQGQKSLSANGSMKKPFVVMRGSTKGNEPYGRSFCMDALGDSMNVQMETRRKAEFIEKGVHPPMGASPEMKNEPSSIRPGEITYVDTSNGKKGFFSLMDVNPNWVAPLVADLKEINARIEKCLYVDVFMAISRMQGVQPRNELELTKRDLERLQELGPFITQHNTEVAGPLIELILDLMNRKGLLKPLPESMAGIPLKLEYVSILTMAQNSAQAVAMKDFLATMGALSSAAKAGGLPDPLRTVNLDETGRHYADVVGFPSNLIFTDEEVAKHDSERERAKQMAQVPGQAMAATAAAKTLADTKLPGVPGGSALRAILGGG